MRVHWTNRALDQLLAIRDHLGGTSAVYAERTVTQLIGRSEQLSAFPGSGRRVPEYDREDVREVIERLYRLIYRVRAEGVDVLAVVHARQELPRTPEGL